MTDPLDVVIADGLTLREWLREVLLAFWEQGEGFSPKRPFGNSGYYSEIAAALEAQGFSDSDEVVADAIRRVFAE